MLLPNIDIFHEYLDWAYQPRSSESFKSRLDNIDRIDYKECEKDVEMRIYFLNGNHYGIFVSEYQEFLRKRNLNLLLN